MPSTTKERLAKMREKRKRDGAQYAEHLRKERERDRERRNKKKEELEKDASLQIEHRLKIRDRVRLYRAKNKCVTVCDSPIGSYKCLQTFSKAVKKVKKTLPESPLKKAAVVKKVFSDILGDPFENKKQGHTGAKLSEEAQTKVQAFFYRDDVSRQAPGIKDPQTGKKVKKQKRTMVTTVLEAYEYFKEVHPEIKIGKSSFYQLRPVEVSPISETPHNVCVCIQHANYLNLFDALKKYLPLPDDHHKLFQNTTCDTANENCMNGSCNDCPKGFWDSFYDKIDQTKQITWKQWITINNRPQISSVTATCEEAFNQLRTSTDKFRIHCYTKKVQADYFEDKKSHIQNNEAVIQLDFAENYALVHQDEIQSAHWSHKQVTIFTCCIWFENETKSVAIVSDDTSHTKQAVWTFLEKVVNYIQLVRSSEITKLYFFTDNCAAQFKNKYILSCLYELREYAKATHLEWNFFSASHGKGAVDGIGGTVKRTAWIAVKARKVLMNSAEDFHNYVKNKVLGIHIDYLSKEAIANHKTFLNNLWDDIKSIADIQKQHHFEVVDNHKILMARTSRYNSFEVVVVKKHVWSKEFLLTIADLKKSLQNEKDDSDVVAFDQQVHETAALLPHLNSPGSSPDFNSPRASCSGIVPSVAKATRKLHYSEVYTDSEDEIIPKSSKTETIKPGVCLLVKFHSGGGRKGKEYRYVGMCQKPVDDDGEVQIMCLKIVGVTGRIFVPDENDICDVPYENIINILPHPALKIKGDRTYYEFSDAVDVFEK